MQHHIIIMVVLLMAVEIPVRRLVVYLHVSHPQRTVDLHLRVEEVGSCVAVVQSRINDLHVLSVGGLELL